MGVFDFLLLPGTIVWPGCGPLKSGSHDATSLVLILMFLLRPYLDAVLNFFWKKST